MQYFVYKMTLKFLPQFVFKIFLISFELLNIIPGFHIQGPFKSRKTKLYTFEVVRVLYHHCTRIRPTRNWPTLLLCPFQTGLWIRPFLHGGCQKEFLNIAYFKLTRFDFPVDLTPLKQRQPVVYFNELTSKM